MGQPRSAISRFIKLLRSLVIIRVICGAESCLWTSRGMGAIRQTIRGASLMGRDWHAVVRTVQCRCARLAPWTRCLLAACPPPHPLFICNNSPDASTVVVGLHFQFNLLEYSPGCSTVLLVGGLRYSIVSGGPFIHCSFVGRRRPVSPCMGGGRRRRRYSE